MDVGRQGVLDEDGFRQLINKMEMIHDVDEVNYLLGQIDPYNNNKMTYSEIVQLLSSHMVPSNDPSMSPGQSIPMLEKLSLIYENRE